MSSSAKAAIDLVGVPDPIDGSGSLGGKAFSIDRVVALFSGADAATASQTEEDDWSASLTAVRGVAARVREMQKNARDTVRDAQRSVREADARARAAEDRARHAEVAMKEAVARAEHAEEQARSTSERADQAEARTAEARAWLRRMHECMVSEFGTLAAEPRT